MSNIGDPISQPIPAVGTSGTTYATEVNEFLTEVKDRLEADVPRSSLASGDLDLDGEALQNAEYLGLAEQESAPTTPVNTIQSFDDELYWVSVDGAVQITDSGNLNVTSVGGIGGDYGGTNPAQLRFVDADQEFYAYDDFANLMWAGIGAGWLDVFATPDGTTRARLLFDGTSSIDITLPDAAPSETVGLQMDSSGNITAERKTKTILLGPSSWAASDGTTETGDDWSLHLTATTNYWQSQASTPMTTTYLVAHLDLEVGAIITAMDFNVDKASDNTNNLVASLESVVATTGSATSLATATANSNAGGAATVAFTSTLPQTIEDDKYYRVRMSISDASPSAADKIYSLKVTYTIP